MENLKNQLKNGYNINDAGVDFSKLQYNSRYHSYDFYSRKFPKQWSNNPLFSPLIESIADQAKTNNVTPLQELDEINKKSNKYKDEPNRLE